MGTLSGIPLINSPLAFFFRGPRWLDLDQLARNPSPDFRSWLDSSSDRSVEEEKLFKTPSRAFELDHEGRDFSAILLLSLIAKVSTWIWDFGMGLVLEFWFLVALGMIFKQLLEKQWL